MANQPSLQPARAFAATGAMRKFADYAQLVKLRLSLTVILSSSLAYAIALPHAFDWGGFLMLSIGGFLVTAAANAANEMLERRWDAIMARTLNRPLAAGRMHLAEASVFAAVALCGGVATLSLAFNWMAGALAAASFILYVFVYTPLKRITHLSVFVGAIPGALPPAIGVLAASGQFSLELAMLFAIQFCWQLPHFWAIGWLGHAEYRKAGFRMLPNGGFPNRFLAANILLYSLALAVLGVVPFWVEVASWPSIVFNTFAAVLMVLPALRLLFRMDPRSAFLVMFGSFFYIPIVWASVLIFKV